MTAADVFAGKAAWSVEQADALDFLRRLPDRSCSLVFFSPPYEAQRTYGIGVKLKGQGWVDWLRPIIVESARVSSGLVLVNAAGPVRDYRYSPAVEWLVSDLTRQDGLVCGPSPYAWTKNGVPGSGGDQYHRRNWEPVYAFAISDRLPLAWADPLAFGKPPKYRLGGEMSNRNVRGERKNDRQPAWPAGGNGRDITRREGSMPEVANPGNVVHAKVGGGNLGHKAAHHNEAPMPVALAERFVCWFAEPESVVCDPFTGSGTTPHASVVHRRRFVGCDVRASQVELTRRRMATVTPNLIGV